MKQITLAKLIKRNANLSEEEKSILNQMFEYLLTNHCRKDSKTHEKLLKILEILKAPIFQVNFKELPSSSECLIWTPEDGVFYQVVSDKRLEIESLKKALMNYHLEITKKATDRERWELFEKYAYRQIRSEQVVEDLQKIRFHPTEEAKLLNASDTFLLKLRGRGVYGVLESLGETGGKKCYNLHLIDPKYGCPCILTESQFFGSFFSKPHDGYQTFEIEVNECPQDFLQQLTEIV